MPATGPFFRRGVTKLIACPVIATPAAPSRSELTAGTVLTGITAISGLSITNSPVDTPDLDSSFTSNIPGEDKAGSTSLTFKDKRNSESTSIRTALAKATSLYLVYMPYGDVPTQRCEVWTVTSTGVNDVVDMSKFAEFQVGFGVTAPPVQNAVIPS